MENLEEINEISITVECSSEISKDHCRIEFGTFSNIQISKGENITKENFKVETGKEIPVKLMCRLEYDAKRGFSEPDKGEFHKTNFTFEEDKNYLIKVNPPLNIEISEKIAPQE